MMVNNVPGWLLINTHCIVLLHGEQYSGWDSLCRSFTAMFHSNIVESAPQRAEDATAATTNVLIAQEGDLPSDDIGM